jgi:mannose PTS system EIID component
VDKLTLGRVLWRLFFLQATWSYQGQQNVGVASAILPALERIYGKWSPDLTRAIMRHLEQFNTQPYMAGAILGSLIKVEEGIQANAEPVQKLQRFRAALTTALAAIGDAFFWNALLPVAAVVGMFWTSIGSLRGVVIFLCLFNLPHLLIRIGGFVTGYLMGYEMVKPLDRLSLPKQTLRLRLFLTVALGCLAAWLPRSMGAVENSSLWFLGLSLLVGPLLFLIAHVLRRGVPVEAVVGITFVVFLTGSYLWF